jgi:hypothetical protein
MSSFRDPSIYGIPGKPGQVYATLVKGQLLDDNTDAFIPRTVIKWTNTTSGVADDGPYYCTSNTSGYYNVMIYSINAVATFTPSVAGKDIQYGSITTSILTNNGPAENWLLIRSLDTSGYPVPVINVSGIIGPNVIQDNDWSNSYQFTVQPIFEASNYPYSTEMPVDHTGDDDSITTGEGTHMRWLWGSHPWDDSDLAASGIPYIYSSGVLTLNAEYIEGKDTETETGSGYIDDNIPSGVKYFSSVIEVSGQTSSALAHYQLFRIQYDTGPPPTPVVTRINATKVGANVDIAAVDDDGTDYDNTYKVQDTNTNNTTNWTEGTYFSIAGVEANTASTIIAHAKDAANNQSGPGTALAYNTLNPDPAFSVHTIHDRSTNGVRVIAEAFPNDGAGSSGYRFRRWDRPNADISTTENLDSGWLTTNQWIDNGDIEIGREYTWELTTRNQDGVVTAPVVISQTVDSPAGGISSAPLPPPASTNIGSVFIPEHVSPIHRTAVRVSDPDIKRTRYNERGIYISKPYTSNDPIYQVTLDTLEQIPESFPNEAWIQYAIKFEPNGNEIPIIPKSKPDYNTIVVNSLLSEQERAFAANAGWIFVDRDTNPYQVILVARLSRPQDRPFASPELRSFAISVKSRDSFYADISERGPIPRAR